MYPLNNCKNKKDVFSFKKPKFLSSQECWTLVKLYKEIHEFEKKWDFILFENYKNYNLNKFTMKGKK